MNQTLSREEQLRQDEKELDRWGYAQQLYRDMGGFSNFAISFSIISVITGAATLYGHGLTYGGPAVFGWGWLLVMFMTLTVSASMAEIASAYPTAGAMYHWASILGNANWGWFTAWFNFIGLVAVVAGVDYGIALFVTPLLGLPETQTIFLTVYAAILTSHALLNHYGIRIVAWLNDFSVIYQMTATLALVAALVFFTPKQPFAFVFNNAWTASTQPYWWAFLVGLLQAQWTLTGYDASAHITEETVDPRKNAPWGMFLSVAVSGVVGYAMLLAITLAIKDLPAAAADANPFIFIISTALGGVAGKIALWVVVGAMWFCGLSCLTSAARMLFAFSRDKGIPGWKHWASIDSKHRTPAKGTWLIACLAFLCALYSKTYSAIVSMCVISLYVSYVIPVALALKDRMQGKWTGKGPWHLGRWGGVINAIAVLWVAFISVLFVAPPNEMAGYTFGAIVPLLTIYFFLRVRGRFKGPTKLMTEEELVEAAV